MDELEDFILGSKDFFFSCSFKQLRDIERYLKQKKVPYALLVCTGAFTNDEAKCVVDYGDEDSNECHFASINYLMSGKDGIVYQLRHPKESVVELPVFEDLFQVKVIKKELGEKE